MRADRGLARYLPNIAYSRLFRVHLVGRDMRLSIFFISLLIILELICRKNCYLVLFYYVCRIFYLVSVKEFINHKCI